VVLIHRRNRHSRAVYRVLAEPKTPRSLWGIVHFCFARCVPCLDAGRDTLQLALAASGYDSAKLVHKPRLLSDNGSSYISSDLA
jgi:hypothetical protein